MDSWPYPPTFFSTAGPPTSSMCLHSNVRRLPAGLDQFIHHIIGCVDRISVGAVHEADVRTFIGAGPHAVGRHHVERLRDLLGVAKMLAVVSRCCQNESDPRPVDPHVAKMPPGPDQGDNRQVERSEPT